MIWGTKNINYIWSFRWYDFIFSNSNTENDEGTQIQKNNEWESDVTLKPENKKMAKSMTF